jgi:hypothetical protein
LIHDLHAHGRCLLRAGDPHRLALEEKVPRIQFEVAGQGLHHGRLARTVVADERDNLAGVDVEVGIVQGAHVAEAST